VLSFAGTGDAPVDLLNMSLAAAASARTYPPAPWTLRGTAIIATRAPRLDSVRHLVPAQLPLQPIWPGRTLAVLALFNYIAGSTLIYHELIIAPALVRAGGRLGAWISHIYVDSAPSLEAGREIWGLPKQFASFEWSKDGSHLRATADGLDLQVRTQAKRRVTIPTPLFAPAFGADGHVLKWLLATGTGQVAQARGEISCKARGIEPLDFDACTLLVRLNRFKLSFPAPRLSTIQELTSG
jgi:hypothetical protein